LGRTSKGQLDHLVAGHFSGRALRFEDRRLAAGHPRRRLGTAPGRAEIDVDRAGDAAAERHPDHPHPDRGVRWDDRQDDADEGEEEEQQPGNEHGENLHPG
jgi:hypothetical protein